MGTIAAENNFWARMQDENQGPPDSKERIRFLLDEIALLEARFDNREQNRLAFRENKNKVGVPVPLESEYTLARGAYSQKKADTKHENHQKVDVYTEELPPRGTLSLLSEEFIQIIEEKLRILLEERLGFYEKAEKELRSGKVERLELARLLQSEKSRLVRHRKELDDLKDKLSKQPNNSSYRMQDILDKLGKLLDERENLHLKFEVQVELGHFFRLLKLLELQKTKDESTKSEVEKNMQEFRAMVNSGKDELQTCTQHTYEELDSMSQIELEANVTQPGEYPTEQETESDLISSRETDARIVQPDEAEYADKGEDFTKWRKEVKTEILRLMAEQEHKWKEQQEVLYEMDRKLAAAEFQNHRLSDLLEDTKNEGHIGEIPRWTGSLPHGYSSIYFSPIFQERKQKDEKDDEISRLKKEIATLKQQLNKEPVMVLEEHNFLDRVQVPIEEKTIPIDASSNHGEINKLSNILDSLHSNFVRADNLEDTGVWGEGDKQFLREAVQNLSTIFEQLQKHLDTLSSNKQLDLTAKEIYIEIFKNMRLQSCNLSKDLQKQIKIDCENLYEESTDTVRIIELESQVKSMKADIIRNAEEYAQQLDRKEKALAYAQELNLRLANDMSNTENALSQLRMEHTGLKALFETQLKDCKKQGEEVAKGFRKEIASLENTVKDKERVIQETMSRAQACQRETDAAVLDKNDVLGRLKRMQEQLEHQNIKILNLEDTNTALKECERQKDQLIKELQTAREEVNRIREEHELLGQRYSEVQSKLMDTEYELEQREAALERLTVHMATAAVQENQKRLEESGESLRSKHKKELARKTIHEAEEKMANLAAEMTKAKLEMEDIKSQGFRLLHR